MPAGRHPSLALMARGALLWLQKLNPDMKTAYELAMERLNKASPAVKLTAAQKQQLAELDSRYGAKIAEREISLRGEIDRAAGAGDADKAEQLQQQLVRDRKALQAELEAKKEAARHGQA
jgi:hypothetical protein